MNKKLLVTLIVVLLIGGIFLIFRGSKNTKIALTNESCFEVENGKITKYDTICGKEINIPSKINNEAVKEIGNNVFSNKEITKVIIPEGVEVIGLTDIQADAFVNNKITKLDIPDSVENIGFAAFNNNLVKSKDEAFIYMRSTNGINKEILVSYAGADKDITIPSNVTELYLNSLSDCELTNVKLNDGLERIDTSALANNKLTKLVIPSSVIIISATALQGNSFEEIVVKGKTDVDTFEVFQNDDSLKSLVRYE